MVLEWALELLPKKWKSEVILSKDIDKHTKYASQQHLNT